MNYTAKVICDSISHQDIRLTTMKLRYPRFIHAEFMTHRVFSRNASSSRAIPTSKMIAEVRGDYTRASPIFWGKNQPGMQAEEELSDEETIVGGPPHYASVVSPRRKAKNVWRKAALDAANHAEELLHVGAHKQIVNRILEPFLHINVVCSFTDFDNFEKLRCHPAAQPEMRALAEAMRDARNASEPDYLSPGDWHLPFVETEDYHALGEEDGFCLGENHSYAQRVSVSRCARVSYESFETGKRSTIDEDLALYERLSKSGHWSPFEHQATPDWFCGDDRPQWSNPHQHGNFTGWKQFRKMLPGEGGK